MVAQPSFAFVSQSFFDGLLNFLTPLDHCFQLCLQLCLKLISKYLWFFVLQSFEVLRSVWCILPNKTCSLEGFPNYRLLHVSQRFLEGSPNVFQLVSQFLQSSAAYGEFYQLWSMYHCRTGILKENNTAHTPPLEDQSWYSLDLFPESNFGFHLISVPGRPNRCGFLNENQRRVQVPGDL